MDLPRGWLPAGASPESKSLVDHMCADCLKVPISACIFPDCRGVKHCFDCVRQLCKSSRQTGSWKKAGGCRFVYFCRDTKLAGVLPPAAPAGIICPDDPMVNGPVTIMVTGGIPHVIACAVQAPVRHDDYSLDGVEPLESSDLSPEVFEEVVKDLLEPLTGEEVPLATSSKRLADDDPDEGPSTKRFAPAAGSAQWTVDNLFEDAAEVLGLDSLDF